MPAHPRAYALIAERLATETDPEQRDTLLDLWLTYDQQATDWDAQMWGFDPCTWQARRLTELRQRARSSADVVPLDDAL